MQIYLMHLSWGSVNSTHQFLNEFSRFCIWVCIRRIIWGFAYYELLFSLSCQVVSSVLYSTKIISAALNSIRLITTCSFLAWQISCSVGTGDARQNQYDDMCTKTGLDRSFTIDCIAFGWKPKKPGYQNTLHDYSTM